MYMECGRFDMENRGIRVYNDRAGTGQTDTFLPQKWYLWHKSAPCSLRIDVLHYK